jgi:hypothetical protein
MKFGLLPFGVLPENLVHRYYGYRGIDHGASIDVPPDRTTYEGQPNDLELPTDEFKSLPFVWWFDTVALPKLNEMVSGLPNDEITTIAETPRYKAYARRVGGYVHVGAWEVRDEHQYDEYEKPTEGKWSGKAELPDLGTKIKINFNGLGEGVVHSYFVEHGFIGVRVKLDKQPDWHKNQEQPPYALVFGAEIEVLAMASEDNG